MANFKCFNFKSIAVRNTSEKPYYMVQLTASNSGS